MKRFPKNKKNLSLLVSTVEASQDRDFETHQDFETSFLNYWDFLNSQDAGFYTMEIETLDRDHGKNQDFRNFWDLDF